MGVLILDMIFPKTCAACEWSRYSFPNAWCGRTHKTTDIEIAKNGRPDWCPLVNIPPHGRLIDADELHSALRKRVKEFSNSEYGYGVKCGLADAREYIKIATTIVPAEEG